MKERIKEIIATVIYMLYQKHILKNHIHVCSVDETIDALVKTDNSLARFGDGEISLIAGIGSATQKSDLELGKRLEQVLQSDEEGLLIALNGIFDGMDELHRKNQLFWKKHLLKFRKYYNQYCDSGRVYYNSFVSRCYYSFRDRRKCTVWFDKIKDIWKDKDVVVVEGEATHNGVGNDLLDQCKSIRRILCPSKNAYGSYTEILRACREFKKNQLFLVSIGAAAKPLVYDLHKEGYRVIDIGNLDLEYEWYLHKTEGKQKLKKHSVIGVQQNQEAHYDDYLEQIAYRIQGDNV